jgi:hypothetical protein
MLTYKVYRIIFRGLLRFFSRAADCAPAAVGHGDTSFDGRAVGFCRGYRSQIYLLGMFLPGSHRSPMQDTSAHSSSSGIRSFGFSSFGTGSCAVDSLVCFLIQELSWLEAQVVSVLFALGIRFECTDFCSTWRCGYA